MKYDTGSFRNLYITRTQPADPSGPGVIEWSLLAGQQVRQILKVDHADQTYFAITRGHIDPVWILEDWIEQLEDANLLRRAWQDDSMTEAKRQMNYASAMQRLMWREFGGVALKKSVGDKAKIRGVANAVEQNFLGSWNVEWYAPCWGKTGVVVEESREWSHLGELHRAYRIAIPGLKADGSEYPTLWFLGEDLEE